MWLTMQWWQQPEGIKLFSAGKSLCSFWPCVPVQGDISLVWCHGRKWGCVHRSGRKGDSEEVGVADPFSVREEQRHHAAPCSSGLFVTNQLELILYSLVINNNSIMSSLNNRNLLSHSLEAGSLRPGCPQVGSFWGSDKESVPGLPPSIWSSCWWSLSFLDL